MKRNHLFRTAACFFAAVWNVWCQEPVVWWDLDGGAATNRGSGGAAYNAALSGAVAFTDGIDGGGLRFPGGSEGYAKLDYTFGDAGTVALWHKPARFFNYNSIFDNSKDPNQWEMWVQANANVRFRLAGGQGDFEFSNLNSEYNGTNAWYHFAITWNRYAETNHARLYINGVERQARNITAWVAPGNAVYFGGHTGNNPGEGILDDVRVYDVALTAEQVQAVHAETAAKAPVVHVTLDGTAANSGMGGARYDAVLNGGPVWTNGWNNKGQALALDGVDDCVAVPYRLNRSATVALWCYVSGPWYNHNSVLDNSDDANSYECWIDENAGLTFRPHWGGPSQAGANLGKANSNRWWHIAATYDVLSSNVVLYVNGVEKARKVATDVASWRTPGTNTYLGGGHPGNAFTTNVYSDLQIFETPLSSDRVAELYGEFGRRGGLVAYVPFDGAAVDVAGSNAVVVTGSPVFVKGQVGKGLSYTPAAIPGDGGSCASVSNVLGSSVGTLALWYYARGPWYNWQPLFDNAVNQEHWESWIYEDGRLAVRVSNLSGGGMVAYDLDNLRGPDNWYHIAFTWNLAEAWTKLYVDGVLRTTATFTETGWRAPDPALRIGSFHSGNKAANGVWDEVRVYDRALTAEEIEALTVIPPPPPPKGSVILLE